MTLAARAIGASPTSSGAGSFFKMLTGTAMFGALGGGLGFIVGLGAESGRRVAP